LKKDRKYTIAKNAAYVILLALILLFPVWYNGYPFVFSDTGTYINSGFESHVPGDRPIFYGLFLRHSSLAVSLFISIFFQAVIVVGTLFYFIKRFSTEVNKTILISISILILLSALPWFTSLLLPDIFTPISFILLLILLLEEERNIYIKLCVLILYWFTTGSHLSNIITQLFFVVLLFGLKLLPIEIFQIVRFKKLFIIALLIFSNWIIVPSIHKIYGGGFIASKSSHIFLIAKNVESGILQKYLKENCPEKNFKLCNYVDELNTSAPEFLWAENSVLYKLGGWQANEDEYKYINQQILTTPKYLTLFIYEAAISGVKQLFSNEVGQEFIKYGENTPPYWEVEWHVKKDFERYKLAKQNLIGLNVDFGIVTMINNIAIWISLLALTFILFIKGSDSKFNLIYILSLFFVVCNAMVSGGLSTVSSRYNSRLSWILIFIAVSSLIQNRKIIATFVRKKLI